MNPELVFQAQRETAQELPNPVHYPPESIFTSPSDTPGPVTYFGGILHGFPMNTLLVRDLKTVFEV